MASRATSDSPNPKGGNDATRTAVRKSVKPSGTIVKSRYMQAAQKSSLSKSNSMNNESAVQSPKPFSPKVSHAKSRRTIAPPTASVLPCIRPSLPSFLDEPSMLQQSVLCSTFSDENNFRPDFDISVIGVMKGDDESDNEPETDSETEKYLIELETFLLTHLTVMMAHNTAKLKAKAQAKLLQEMEEQEAVRQKAHALKRQYLLMAKERQRTELLVKQNAALAPLAEVAEQFTKNYTTFATAVDATRHEMQIKNFFIEEEHEFLDKVEAQLQKTEKLLMECPAGKGEDNLTCIEYLSNMKASSKDISQQMSGAFSELQELTSLLAQNEISVQQSIEEERLGPKEILELYGLNP